MARRAKAKEKGRISDELPAGEDSAEAFRNGELLSEMKKAVAERALNAEMDHHLSQEPARQSGNHRNGHNRKRVATESGSMDLSVPRTWRPAGQAAVGYGNAALGEHMVNGDPPARATGGTRRESCVRRCRGCSRVELYNYERPHSALNQFRPRLPRPQRVLCRSGGCLAPVPYLLNQFKP